METLRQIVEKNRTKFSNTFKQEALRANGTATKEYLDWLEGYMAKQNNSCKGCVNYNNGIYDIDCHGCRRYCADLFEERK
jgi:hypothetical protein